MRNFLYIKKYTLILKRILRIRHFFHVCMRKSFLTFLHAHFIDILFLTSFLTYIFCFLHLYIVSYIFHIGVFLSWAKTAFCSAKGFCPNQREEKKALRVLSQGRLSRRVALAPQKVTKGLSLSQIQASREKSKLKGKVVKITIYISGKIVNKAVSKGAGLLPLIYACSLCIVVCMLAVCLHLQQAILQPLQAHYTLRLLHLSDLYNPYMFYKAHYLLFLIQNFL